MPVDWRLAETFWRRLAEAPSAESVLAGFLFVLTRTGAAVAMVPLPGFRNAAAAPRIVLILALTVLLVPVWPQAGAMAREGIAGMAWRLAPEAALGLAAGVTVAWVTEVFAMAMQFISLQAGYSYASTIDPSSQTDAGILPVIAQIGAGLLFFAIGLDRQVLRAFAASFEQVPPGAFRMTGEMAAQLGVWTGALLSLAFRLALPVVGFLLLLDLTLALLGRVQAHLPLLNLAMPVKMASAMAMIAVLSGSYPAILGKAAAPAFEFLWSLAGRKPPG